VPFSPPFESSQSGNCLISLRRIDGPIAQELFFSCTPAPGTGSAEQQTAAIYCAIRAILSEEGADLDCLIAETIFFGNIHRDREAVRTARKAILGVSNCTFPGPALTELEQAPLQSGAAVEVLAHAIVPRQGTPDSTRFSVDNGRGGADCEDQYGIRVRVGSDTRFYAGGLYGEGSNSYEQTRAVFTIAEKLLHEAGLGITDVMRTWFYFPQMERDYDGFNRARREFFQSRSVEPIPASTGIGAGLVSPAHCIGLGLYAARGTGLERTVMKTPMLNEAPEDGADFSRGMRIEESNRTSLHVSGTASLDETGATVHFGDFDAQVDRMLLNVASLLEGQGAGFGDIVSAITYVKQPEDAPRLRSRFEAAGYTGFPNVVVHAPVCRPELLCETEALAILRKT
jgi:enamine deaminase RidA (YjgF/YER057c/UK114 family)